MGKIKRKYKGIGLFIICLALLGKIEAKLWGAGMNPSDTNGLLGFGAAFMKVPFPQPLSESFLEDSGSSPNPSQEPSLEPSAEPSEESALQPSFGINTTPSLTPAPSPALSQPLETDFPPEGDGREGPAALLYVALLLAVVVIGLLLLLIFLVTRPNPAGVSGGKNHYRRKP